MTYVVPPECAGEGPREILTAIVEQAKGADSHRQFTVQDIPSAMAARALGKVRAATVPTQALGVNILELVNNGQQPTTVKYVKTQKTYRVAIRPGGVGVLCWEGAKPVMVQPNQLTTFFTPLLRPEQAILDRVILPAVQQATMEASHPALQLTTEISLSKPIAVPAGYLERHVQELR